MNEPENRPGNGFLQIRARIWGIAILCFTIVGLLILIGTLEDRRNENLPDGSNAVEGLATKQAPSNPDPKSVPSPDPPEFKVDSPVYEEPHFEEAVFQTELTVILVSRSILGQISVERYDSDGNPTGEPLKSGTQVQIPDPDWPGERIYFKVP